MVQSIQRPKMRGHCLWLPHRDVNSKRSVGPAAVDADQNPQIYGGLGGEMDELSWVGTHKCQKTRNSFSFIDLRLWLWVNTTLHDMGRWAAGPSVAPWLHSLRSSGSLGQRIARDTSDLRSVTLKKNKGNSTNIWGKTNENDSVRSLRMPRKKTHRFILRASNSGFSTETILGRWSAHWVGGSAIAGKRLRARLSWTQGLGWSWDDPLKDGAWETMGILLVVYNPYQL